MTESSVHRIGRHTLDGTRGSLSIDGHEVPLRPKSFALLEHLAANAGRLVRKDELLAALWPGLVVTDDSLTRCISEVRAALGDDAHRLRTLPRRGYLLDASTADAHAEPGSATADGPPGAAMSTAAPPAVAPARTRTTASTALALLMTVAAIVALAGWHVWPPASAPRLTLAVVPFADPAPPTGGAHLAQALTDELTIALARLRGASVVAAPDPRTGPDPRRLGADLGVRYLVQGGLADAGARLRINARLIDAPSGRLVWSDQLDVTRAELAAGRDDIVLRLTNALSIELVRADARRSATGRTPTPDAEDVALQCEAATLHHQGEAGGPGYELCERALQLDPHNVRALVQLATYHAERVERRQSPDPASDQARAREWTDRALAIAPNDAAAHCAQAIVLGNERKVRDAIVAARRCQALDPSHAKAYHILAIQHFFLAEPRSTLDWVDRGLRLGPRDPLLAGFLLFGGWAHLMLEQDEQALEWLRRADVAVPDTPSIQAPLISALALTGHDAEARALLARYLANPRTHARTISAWAWSPDASPAFERFAEHFRAGLRRAGMADN